MGLHTYQYAGNRWTSLWLKLICEWVPSPRKILQSFLGLNQYGRLRKSKFMIALLCISLWNLQIALVTDFPGVIIITSDLFGRSMAAYWLCWYKRYVTKVFCIYRKLFCNRLSEPWASHCDCKSEHSEMAYVSSWMSRKETSMNNLYFHK